MSDSLWTIPPFESLKTPLSILKHQATLLTEETQGLLIGVATAEGGGNGMINNLTIVVPNLNNYRYRILAYTHAIVNLYPGELIALNNNYRIISEDQFLYQLRSILSSDEVVTIVGNLMGQAGADKLA